MKIGLAGAGRIGTFHARSLADDPRVSQLRITDMDPARAQSLAASLGAETSADAEELAKWADALVIATATDAHAELIELGAREGLPTFCEKPISLDLATTDRVLAVVARSGIALQIGFQRRFDSGFAEVRRLVESGALGRIYAARLATHDPAPPPGAYLKTSGGLYADLMIHDFDILRWTTGLDITSVYATGSALTGDPAFEEAGDVDTAAVLATLEHGAPAVITGLRHNPRGYDVRLELFGSRDSIVTGMDSRAPIRSVDPDTGSDGGTEKTEYTDFLDRFGDAYRAEVETFISVARGEMENLSTGNDAREALRAAEAAALSAREGRVVNMSEIR